MAVFLFWNVHHEAIAREVALLCKYHDVDVLILAEASFTDFELQHNLTRETERVYIALYNELSSRLRFFFRYPPGAISPVRDIPNRLSIREIQPPSGNSILLAAVHLVSKLHADDSDQASQARSVTRAIEEAEATVGHCRTLVIGDFNMNPFEGGLIDADAFHGVMTQTTAQKITRTVAGSKRNFFYNPMWGKFGDGSEGSPGTYYYSSAKNRQFFWNMFDQVLLRPDLLPTFKMDNLKVLTEIGETPLLKAGNIDRSISDHLPIMIKLPIELEGL